MARQNLATHYFPFSSAADYSSGSAQFHFVKHNGTTDSDGIAVATLCTVAGELALGICQDRPKSGETMTVLSISAPAVAKIAAGAANIANGALITTDATGRAIAATTGNYAYGIAQNPGGANAVGDLIEVLLAPIGKI